MAILKFKRLTGSKKSALVLVKPNKFQMAWEPVYVGADAVEGMQEDEVCTIPDGYTLSPIHVLDPDTKKPVVDIETGELKVMCAKDGSPLHTLCWK